MRKVESVQHLSKKTPTNAKRIELDMTAGASTDDIASAQKSISSQIMKSADIAASKGKTKKERLKKKHETLTKVDAGHDVKILPAN